MRKDVLKTTNHLLLIAEFLELLGVSFELFRPSMGDTNLYETSIIGTERVFFGRMEYKVCGAIPNEFRL